VLEEHLLSLSQRFIAGRAVAREAAPIRHNIKRNTLTPIATIYEEEGATLLANERRDRSGDVSL